MVDFSFIIPVYNVEKYIRRCVDSILNQNYKNFEIILINDGSTDNSGAICDEYAKVDKRVHVIHSENNGPSTARNIGIKSAKGNYSIFLDSDDFWCEDKLEAIYKKCCNEEIDLLVFNYNKYDEKKKIISETSCVNFPDNLDEVINGEKFLAKVLEENPLYEWYSWFYAIKTDILIKNDLNFKTNIKYEDVDLMYKIILLADKVSILNENVLNYSINRLGSITNVVKLSTEKDKLEVVKNNIKNVQMMNIDEKLKKLLSNNFSCLYYSSVILLNSINDKLERATLSLELKEALWVGKYTKNKSQKVIYYLIRIFGIKIISRLLDIRRILKEGV